MKFRDITVRQLMAVSEDEYSSIFKLLEAMGCGLDELRKVGQDIENRELLYEWDHVELDRFNLDSIEPGKVEPDGLKEFGDVTTEEVIESEVSIVHIQFIQLIHELITQGGHEQKAGEHLMRCIKFGRGSFAYRPGDEPSIVVIPEI